MLRARLRPIVARPVTPIVARVSMRAATPPPTRHIPGRPRCGGGPGAQPCGWLVPMDTEQWRDRIRAFAGEIEREVHDEAAAEAVRALTGLADALDAAAHGDHS